MSSRAGLRITALAPTQKVASKWVRPWWTRCWMSVVAPATRSRRVLAPRERRVGGLDDRDALVAGKLALVDQPEAVLAQEHAVGVEREHVVAVGDLQGVGGIAVAQDRAQLGLDLLDPASHQPEVGVEVHRLVRVVRQVGVLLALEGGDVPPRRSTRRRDSWISRSAGRTAPSSRAAKSAEP